jgi:catechol 2,3-dioxygenase-like lactoylglutathione lyase family enzyme
MNLPDVPIATEGFFATHFFTVRDQEKSKDFYVRFLGGKVIKAENPCYIKLANTWINLNSGGGPTPDKPEVILETPSDLNRGNSFLNLRVADIWTCYKQWSDKGAFFLTGPLNNHGWEWRCYMRDPDDYLIEVGQYTQIALDHFRTYASEVPKQLTPKDERLGESSRRRRDGRSARFARRSPVLICS